MSKLNLRKKERKRERKRKKIKFDIQAKNLRMSPDHRSQWCRSFHTRKLILFGNSYLQVLVLF